MSQTTIRRCAENDFEVILSIICDGARAYTGHIPADCLHDPHMSHRALRNEIESGVEFWGCSVGDVLVAVMGMQSVRDVVLIRHAYVRQECQNQGFGSRMIIHLSQLTDEPMLVGTWTDAVWAIRFYQRHGFSAVEKSMKDGLLKRYWSVPERQIETSIVLADERWRTRTALFTEEL